MIDFAAHKQHGEAAWIERLPNDAGSKARAPKVHTELTPEGEQYVIPGCEKNASPRAVQLNLF
jgi:hypothetical protein